MYADISRKEEEGGIKKIASFEDIIIFFISSTDLFECVFSSALFSVQNGINIVH